MNKLHVYLPCYNEAGNIRSLTEAWLDEGGALAEKGYRLRITGVDDKSTDGTLDILRELAERYPEVSVIAHPVNRNLGGVLTTSVRDFLEVSGENDLMCFMDADNTHKPRFVHSMLEKLSGIGRPAACVIASRYQPGAGVQGLTRDREWFSSMAKLYYSAVLHVPNVRDYTCGYRLYTRQALGRALEKYGERLIERQSFACMMELLYKLHKSGCRFGEVPFQLYYDDKEGESKMRVAKTIRDSLLTALELRFSV